MNKKMLLILGMVGFLAESAGALQVFRPFQGSIEKAENFLAVLYAQYYDTVYEKKALDAALAFESDSGYGSASKATLKSISELMKDVTRKLGGKSSDDASAIKQGLVEIALNLYFKNQDFPLDELNKVFDHASFSLTLAEPMLLTTNARQEIYKLAQCPSQTGLDAKDSLASCATKAASFLENFGRDKGLKSCQKITRAATRAGEAGSLELIEQCADEVALYKRCGRKVGVEKCYTTLKRQIDEDTKERGKDKPLCKLDSTYKPGALAKADWCVRAACTQEKAINSTKLGSRIKAAFKNKISSKFKKAFCESSFTKPHKFAEKLDKAEEKRAAAEAAAAENEHLADGGSAAADETGH